MTDEPINKPRTSKWRILAIDLLIFIVVMAGIRAWQQRDVVSGPAPVLKAVTLTGQPYTLPMHPSRPLLVHFWATWCPICRMEQDAIASIAHNNPEVITIAMQSGKPEEVVRYMKEQGISFPAVNDPDGSLSATWGVHAVPASFIIAPDGQIRFVEVGYTTGIGLKLRLWWAGI